MEKYEKRNKLNYIYYNVDIYFIVAACWRSAATVINRKGNEKEDFC